MDAPVQRRGPDAPPAVSPGLESYVAGSRAGGQPLPAATRAYFEPRFDRDFSDVRLHADSRAAIAAAEIGAHAFTSGSDVYFGAGQLQPGTAQGDRLLAHELTHVSQQTGAIQRQPTSTRAAAPTTADRREFVQETINFLNRSAATYGDRFVTVNRAIFDRVMTSWYRMVVTQESIIDRHLGRNAALKRDLRAAYTAALRVLMTRAATALRKSEDDLYRENSGRIPMWAWQTAHHMERGITTPIAQGRTVNRAGNVDFSSNGFRVTILPDRIASRLTTGAETEAAVSFQAPGFTHGSAAPELVTAFDPVPRPNVEIRTAYRTAGAAAGRSAYGRGTTAEDVAGGAVTPRSTTLRFHEGTHGLAYVEFLANNPPPRFTGRVGMTRVAFEAASNLYLSEGTAYSDRMKKYSLRSGDCVGTTIDQHNRSRAAGARIVLQCP